MSPLVTARPKARPVVALNVLETVGLVAVKEALYGPVVEQAVAARVPAVPPRPLTVSAIVGFVPPHAAVKVTCTVIEFAAA